MKNKTLILLGAAVLIFAFFWYLIPVTLVHDANFFWGFVGSIASGVCIFFAGKGSEDEMYDIDNYKNNNRKQGFFIVAAMLVAIVGAFFLSFHFGDREEKFIEANPMLVQGTILDGTSKTGGKSSSYELNIRYLDSNGTVYKKDIDVSSTEWSEVGKGMDVSVVYEKDNPGICKLLIHPQDAMKYVARNKRIYPGLKELLAFLNTNEYADQKKLLGDNWSVSKAADIEEGIQFENAISQDQLLISKNLGNIYLNERQQDISYNAILAEAKKTMKVVYDSMATNTTKGIFLENDSMQIRFQTYSSYQKKEKDNTSVYDISSLIPTMTKISCFGFAKKGKGNFILLPGDLESLSTKSDDDKLMDIIKQK